MICLHSLNVRSKVCYHRAIKLLCCSFCNAVCSLHDNKLILLKSASWEGLNSKIMGEKKLWLWYCLLRLVKEDTELTQIIWFIFQIIVKLVQVSQTSAICKIESLNVNTWPEWYKSPICDVKKTKKHCSQYRRTRVNNIGKTKLRY